MRGFLLRGFLAVLSILVLFPTPNLKAGVELDDEPMANEPTAAAEARRSSRPEIDLPSVPVEAQQCMWELEEQITAGMVRQGLSQAPIPFWKVHNLGVARMLAPHTQTIKAVQDRMMKLEPTFGVIGTTGVLAAAIADELRGQGRRRTPEQVRNLFLEFRTTYPDALSQHMFLDRILERVLRVVSAPPVSYFQWLHRRKPVSRFAKLQKELATSPNSSYAELQMYILYICLNPSQECVDDVTRAVPRLFSWTRFWQHLKHQPTPTVMAAIQARAEGGGGIVELVRRADPRLRDALVTRNLLLFSVPELKSMNVKGHLHLSDATLGLVEFRLQQIAAEKELQPPAGAQ